MDLLGMGVCSTERIGGETYLFMLFPLAWYVNTSLIPLTKQREVHSSRYGYRSLSGAIGAYLGASSS